MTKTEIITRLGELSGLLGRDMDTSGTVAELEMRLLEAEDELSSLSETLPTDGKPTLLDDETAVETQLGSDPAPSGRVLIRTAKTLHLNIFSKGRHKGELVKPGREVEISDADFKTLKGYVIRV